jgi:hypothetical protein
MTKTQIMRHLVNAQLNLMCDDDEAYTAAAEHLARALFGCYEARDRIAGASRNGTSGAFEASDAGSTPAAPISGGSSNGRTPRSERGDRGSSPCPPSTSLESSQAARQAAVNRPSAGSIPASPATTSPGPAPTTVSKTDGARIDTSGARHSSSTKEGV